MKYRLGLDVGTASVGLVALELDGDNQPVKPVWHSVRIFDEPLLPPKSGGVGEPKKAARRLARQQRRGHERRSRRMKRIAQLAKLMDLEPETVPADKGQRIHELRASAVTSKISLPDLLRVLLVMSKRRGYAGGFKVKKDKDSGQVETGIGNLKTIMQKQECETLGQYLWYRIKYGQHLRLKDDKDGGLFADRQMVEDEFNRIWKTQEQYHQSLKKNHNGKSLQNLFYKAIVEQRPLKSPAAMVGNCSLEPMLPRAPMAQPMMQAFRIEKQIADLRWGSTRRAQQLSPEQREVIRKQLQDKKEVKFTSLYKELEKAGCPGPEGRELNLAHGDRETLTGDRTAAAMKSLKLLEKWRELTEGHQISVINLLADMGSPEAFDAPEWDKRLKGSKDVERKIKPAVKNFIEEMLKTGKFDRLTKMGFDGGRAGYSIKALRKLVATMRERDVNEQDAIALAYPEANKSNSELLGKDMQRNEGLPEPRPTRNTVVDVALRQVHREVNAAIAGLGTPPSEIIIELSRDMKTGLKARDESIKRMRANEKRRREAAREIEKYTTGSATQSQIRRYLLWKEQGEKYCPYCTDPINISDVINGNETEYEHILPKSLTRIGKKRDYLVLAHKACNQAKKDKTPWQAWGHDEERWRIIEHRAEQFKNNKNQGKARQLLIRDFETEALDDEVINDFTERQFQESAWIAKECGKWLRSICSNVFVSRGLLTAHLRRTWGLDTVIPEVRYEEGMPVFDEDYQPNKKESDQAACKVAKEDFDRYRSHWEGHPVSKDNRPHRRLNKRIDHRHHLIDALVIALTSRSLYQRMAVHYKNVSDSGEKTLRLYAEPELKDIRRKALELVRTCLPSHRPDRWLAGNMFKEKPSVIREENGNRFYAQRKMLNGLAEKDIENIVSEPLRDFIRTTFEQRIGAGKTPEQAWQDPILHPQYKTPIRRVLIRGYTAPDAVRVEHGNRATDLYKYLEPAGYACLEFDSEDTGSEPRLMRLHEAMKPETQRRSSSNVVRLYKSDTVYDARDEKHYVIRQIKEQGPSLMLSPITEAVADIGKVSSPRQRKISGKQIKKLALVKDGRPSHSSG